VAGLAIVSGSAAEEIGCAAAALVVYRLVAQRSGPSMRRLTS
jgi:hypothetical protein